MGHVGDDVLFVLDGFVDFLVEGNVGGEGGFGVSEGSGSLIHI